MSPNLAYLHAAMRRHFEPKLDLERWWPARTRLEVIVSAILVRNTAWSNVELAMASLRRARRLSLAGLRVLSAEELGTLIRSAGCWREKATCLRSFVTWLDEAYGGSLQRMFAAPTPQLRAQLLELRGIGPETADAILLFGGGHARFVVDAYTRRILERHRLGPFTGSYEELAAWCAAALPAQARHYRDCHALLVETAKRYCHKGVPDCAACPLESLLTLR